jgi:predicted RNA-binding protein with EMAP domain
MAATNKQKGSRVKRPPRPREFWIWDQVVRRGRAIEDVAEDLGLETEWTTYACGLVDRWYELIQDECLPGHRAEEAAVAMRFLIQLRLLAQRDGRVAIDDDPGTAVQLLLGELMGINAEDLKTYKANTSKPGADAATPAAARV